MDRWQNKVAVVTGASAGIGAACVRDLVKAGLIVVGLARREHRVQEIRDSLPEDQRSRLHPVKCDVTNESEVIKTFQWIDSKLGGADILVNNAGIVRQTELVKKDNTQDIKDVIETNILGVVYCTREYFNSMQARKVNDGHVVIVNSIAGHSVPYIPDSMVSFNIYPSTKYAVTAMTEVYRQEFAKHGTNIKITSISPGVVDTEIFPAEMEAMKQYMPMLKSEDISDAVLYVIGTPPRVQIHELTIKPVGEKF